MDPAVLTVYNPPFPKRRVGKDNDGGYVIVDIPVSYSLLLSAGIADDVSFEEAFLKMHNVDCYAFDGTIDKLPSENKAINFIKKNIGDINNDECTNMHDLIDRYNNIFLKMDIEGMEIGWLKSLSDEQINKFEQIAIEFHMPFSASEMEVFEKLNKSHILVHFHGNNGAGARVHNGIIIPNIFECTYIHRKHYAGELKLNTDPIPSSLDMRNVLWNDEIRLNHPPFVNTKQTYYYY